MRSARKVSVGDRVELQRLSVGAITGVVERIERSWLAMGMRRYLVRVDSGNAGHSLLRVGRTNVRRVLPADPHHESSPPGPPGSAE
jgi:hypothetical protein